MSQSLVYLSDACIPSKEANSIQIMKMCDAFSKHGVNVTLMAPEIDSIPENIFEFYGVDASFKIYRTPLNDLLYWSPFKKLYNNYVSASVAKRRNPDIIYSRSPIHCYFSAKMGLDVIFESHQPVKHMPRGYWLELFFKRTISSGYLENVVVISEALAQYYVGEYGIDRQQITVAHDAAEPINEGCRPADLPTEDGRLQAGYVGNLYEGKGIGTISKVARECPNITFHIVGGKDEDVRKWKENTNDCDNIRFHGFVPKREVNSYLLALDVLLAPYRQEVRSSGGSDLADWMSPLKIFEYMAAGKPIIASDLPVLREILTPQKNAILCEPEEVRKWVKALQSLNNNPQLRETLGSHAQQDFRKNHTWEKRAEIILESINKNNF